ncbi:hypothetical protein LKO27_00200 [Tessaracoccus sp. OS52]|uniref:hypothetical protein n=1 Tax=Tessaracoccus sp. OS52 TaxID=2886691 RepID=UPI001D1242DD|nr:hypothetical protein [Tessaracoccus sp. OS52]MCC2591851.1 hypothetical protein [Tessaracoccus sp. OS52]
MSIPTVHNFTSATVVDRYDDMINPPGLTNHVVVAQVDHDVLAVRSVNLPPLSQGDCVTGRLLLDGVLAQSLGQPVEHVWRPDRVTRTTLIDAWRLETVTVVPPGSPGVVVRISVTNSAQEERELDLGVWVDSQLVKAIPWRRAVPPRGHNRQVPEGARRRGHPASPPKGMAYFGALEPSADVTTLQGLVNLDGSDVTDVSEDANVIRTRTTLGPGATWEGAFILVLGDEGADVDGAFQALAADVDGAISASEESWNRELADLFEPGGEITSGSLPLLETSNDALRQLYWWGAMGVLWFRRENPAGVRARHYDTLMPRYWQTTTFIWDYSLSSMVHALSDPEEMREQILHWIGLDINEHFGTEWLTGGPAGNWYSVNQYAMVRLVNDYVTLTGDTAFLDEQVEIAGDTSSVGDHVRQWALEWRDKRVGSALADYGEIDNLLECVSTYVHEVASLNAANVWCMRTAAALSRLQGLEEEGADLERQASDLVPEIMALYRSGQGYFNARHPDGSLVPVQHCYDFSTVGTTIPEDLPAEVRSEMVRFFADHLRTPTWMRALSASDPNAGFSVRPDHQWNGAYPAWPADSARAAIQLGGAGIVADWLPGLARSTNQGPPGQAHMVEEAVPHIDGGARKAPPQFPYLIDWSCSSAGAWCELVVESIFGVRAEANGSVSVRSALEHFDPDARLKGLRIAGVTYDVDANGVHPSGNGDAS